MESEAAAFSDVSFIHNAKIGVQNTIKFLVRKENFDPKIKFLSIESFEP